KASGLACKTLPEKDGRQRPSALLTPCWRKSSTPIPGFMATGTRFGRLLSCSTTCARSTASSSVVGASVWLLPAWESAGNSLGMSWASARRRGGKQKGAKTRPSRAAADGPPHAGRNDHNRDAAVVLLLRPHRRASAYPDQRRSRPSDSAWGDQRGHGRCP